MGSRHLRPLRAPPPHPPQAPVMSIPGTCLCDGLAPAQDFVSERVQQRHGDLVPVRVRDHEEGLGGAQRGRRVVQQQQPQLAGRRPAQVLGEAAVVPAAATAGLAARVRRDGSQDQEQPLGRPRQRNSNGARKQTQRATPIGIQIERRTPAALLQRVHATIKLMLQTTPLRGGGDSKKKFQKNFQKIFVRPFACCVGSLRSVGRCGRCSCWCRFRVHGAQ